jgi:hypothetical protein
MVAKNIVTVAKNVIMVAKNIITGRGITRRAKSISIFTPMTITTTHGTAMPNTIGTGTGIETGIMIGTGIIETGIASTTGSAIDIGRE